MTTPIIPLKFVFAAGKPVATAEWRTGDVLAVEHGGTGAADAAGARAAIDAMLRGTKVVPLVDINTLTEAGRYIGYQMPNAPHVGWILVIVESNSSDQVFQRLVSAGYAGGQEWKRWSSNGGATWSALREIWDDGNFDPATKLNAVNPASSGKMMHLGDLFAASISLGGDDYGAGIKAFSILDGAHGWDRAVFADGLTKSAAGYESRVPSGYPTTALIFGNGYISLSAQASTGGRQPLTLGNQLKVTQTGVCLGGNTLLGPVASDTGERLQVAGSIANVGTTNVSSTALYDSTFVSKHAAASAGGKSGTLWEARSAGNQPAWGSIHVEASADYRSKVVVTFSADQFGGEGFAVRGFSPMAGATTEHLLVTKDGDLLVGVASGSCHRIIKDAAVGGSIISFGSASLGTAVFCAVNGGYLGNAAASAFAINLNTITGRSINAGGTINGSGADYAEYERAKKEFIAKIMKGAIIGFDDNGELTLIFSEARSFGVKSSDPCMVGGDSWGTEEQVGKRPEAPLFVAPVYAGSRKPADLPAAPVELILTLPVQPIKQDGETKSVFAARTAAWKQACAEVTAAHEAAISAYKIALDAYVVAAAEYQAALAQYDADQVTHQQVVADAQAEFDTVTMPAYQFALDEFEAYLEEARRAVDRIAYSGKVPVNVMGATVGDYIIAVQSADGGIEGKSVSEDKITFAQYRKAVGRVRKILPDGRALIAVMVH